MRCDGKVVDHGFAAIFLSQIVLPESVVGPGPGFVVRAFEVAETDGFVQVRQGLPVAIAGEVGERSAIEQIMVFVIVIDCFRIVGNGLFVVFQLAGKPGS